MSRPEGSTDVDRGEWAITTSLLLVGLGFAIGSRLLLIAATLPLWYVAAGALGASPSRDLVFRRTMAVGGDSGTADSGENGSATAGGDASRATAPDTPDGTAKSGDAGERVTVRTTVENASGEPLTDVRVADGVPDSLSVVEGSPRTCVTLEPGETATVEYAVELERGHHEFADVSVRVRDLTGTVTETWTTTATGDARLECQPVVENVPLGSSTNDYGGQVPTDEGGSGVEFYSVRGYEPGDPVRSIDWRRYAETRDLATVEFRAERSTRVLCLVDGRPGQFVTAPDSNIPAVSLSVDAAARTFETLVSAGHPTGVAGLASGKLYVVPPGTGAGMRQRVRKTLEAIRVGDTPEEEYVDRYFGSHATQVHKAVPGETQVFLFSSLEDDRPVELVEQLQSRGYVIHVVSPNLVRDLDEDAPRLERIARENRLSELRATGAHVVDWDLSRPLGLVLRSAIGEVTTR